jgi:lysophospholipase L1-like esterase
MLFFLQLMMSFAPPTAEELQRWEPDINKIEARLKAEPSAKNSVLFAGSSMIRLWDTARAFPNLSTVNVGFGGSQTRWNTAFADRIIIPVKPKVIVFYCGDNDLNSKLTPKEVIEDFEAFIKLVRTKLPETKLLILSVKPSPKRWSLFAKQTEVNKQLAAICEKDAMLGFIDTVPGTLGTDGKPIREHFHKDELHFSEAGYVNWQKLVAAELAKHSEILKK